MRSRVKDLVIFSFEDEFKFWGLQIKEHMLFIYQGLVEDQTKPNTLRQEAAQLHNSWHNMLEINPLTQTNFKQTVIYLLDRTLDYQFKIQDLIKNNVWIGWLSYSFLDHLINESNYFKDKISNPSYNLKREIEFWLLHHQTEIEASEKLIDPLEITLCEIIKIYVDEVKALRIDLDFINERSNLNINELSDETKDILEEYLIQTDGLKDGIITKSILTNISLPLINHVIREGERAIQIFTLLGQY